MNSNICSTNSGFGRNWSQDPDTITPQRQQRRREKGGKVAVVKAGTRQRRGVGRDGGRGGGGGDDEVVVLASGVALPRSITHREEPYAPITQKVLRTIVEIDRRDPRWLISALFQSLFGDVLMVHNLVRMWCRTLHRGKPMATPGQFLRFLATAPVAPCIRHHRVGGHQQHVILFLPFGIGSPLAANLTIPVSLLDPRAVRVMQLLVHNPWTFPSMVECPIFGHVTYTCFAYTETAQRKWDACRPLALAAAVRAIVTQVRLEVARTECSTNIPKNPMPGRRVKIERGILSRAPTFIRASLERKILDTIQHQIHQKSPPSSSSSSSSSSSLHHAPETATTKHQALGMQLLDEAWRFVLREHTSDSLRHNPRRLPIGSGAMPTCSYTVLPTDVQITVFAQETQTEWLKAINLSPPPSSSSSSSF